MRMNENDRRKFDEHGFVLIPGCFSAREVETLRDAFRTCVGQDEPGRVFERDGATVRALHGCHRTNRVFGKLVLHPRIVGPAEEILGERLYVYQFKINVKASFGGDSWPWHQDFIYWAKEDGMSSPDVVNVALFLDDVNEFNGPLYFIPGSQRRGMIEVSSSAPGGGWESNVSADLSYVLDRDVVRSMVDAGGIVAPKGPSGSVLFFHSNLAHGSGPNISPYDRRLVIMTYNSVRNVPLSTEPLRPEFLVSRDTRPITALADDALLQEADLSSR